MRNVLHNFMHLDTWFSEMLGRGLEDKAEGSVNDGGLAYDFSKEARTIRAVV